ncbi:hypothetical protein IT570_08620 [Candidatus Sumerlaeota bacterium]|nr:hypothetical protein [Candidatus Sumerlaeota bacterium]
MKRNALLKKRSVAMAALIAAATGITSHADARVILQYFESKWESIDHKMPDVFMAGYGTLYLPPPARADSGNQSVGFDVFDRFDLGKENNETLYGTESSLRNLVKQAHRAGILIYVDTVYNHNGFSDGYRDNQAGDEGCAFRWEKDSGGYPGFIMNGSPFGLPYDLDFHNVCPSAQFPQPSCDSDPFNCRTSNLIDINHDSPSFWVRHPAFPNDPQNIPYQTVREENVRLYPDQDLATFTNEFGEQIHPFNLNDPEAGDPSPEYVSGMLRRYTQWMLEEIGVDGFRLDAVKHTPPQWFVDVYDRAANSAAKDFWGRRTTPFSSGENVNSSFDALAPYHRKDYGRNRTVLDFPLKFALQGNIGNNLQNILGSSFDAYDGNGQDGSAGVMFVQSHDNGYIGDPPFLPNIAYAYILSRKGYPIVYFNAQEFGTGRDFPNRNGRGDALGVFGNTITSLVDISNELVNDRDGNDFNDIWHDDDVIAYELRNTAVIGICDRDDRGGNNDGYEQRTVTLPGFRSVTLKEITGNASNSTVDPDNDIPDTINVPGNGVIDLRVPTNKNDSDVAHGKSYVVYTVAPPEGTFSVSNVVSTLGPELADPGSATPEQRAKARLTPVDVVRGNSTTVTLQINQGAGSLEDNALIRWNQGINIDGVNDAGNPFGLFLLDIPGAPFLNGLENFTTKSPSVDGAGQQTGTGTYSVTVNLTNPAIPEGYNYLTSIAFIKRLNGLPALWQTFRKVIYVDNFAPDLALLFPETQTGINDINSSSFGFVMENPDATGNSMHYFWNLPAGTNPVTGGLVNEGNKATKTDRTRYRFTLNSLVPGDNQKLTVVLFEETGTYALQTFNIGIGQNAATVTPTASPSPSPSISPTPTGSPSPSPSISPSVSPSSVNSPTPSLTPTVSPTLSPSPTPPPTMTPQANPLGFVVN